MNFQIQMEQMPGYLAARFIGSAETGEGLGQFTSIAEHCKRTKNDKLLIDTTEFDVKVSIIDRYLLGNRLLVFARHRIKVAFFSKAEQLDPRKFGAIVAQNRGASVDVFTDFQAAEEWLLK